MLVTPTRIDNRHCNTATPQAHHKASGQRRAQRAYATNAQYKTYFIKFSPTTPGLIQSSSKPNTNTTKWGGSTNYSWCIFECKGKSRDERKK